MVLLILPVTVHHSQKSKGEIILTTMRCLGGVENTGSVLSVTFIKLSPIFYSYRAFLDSLVKSGLFGNAGDKVEMKVPCS